MVCVVVLWVGGRMVACIKYMIGICEVVCDTVGDICHMVVGYCVFLMGGVVVFFLLFLSSCSPQKAISFCLVMRRLQEKRNVNEE